VWACLPAGLGVIKKAKQYFAICLVHLTDQLSNFRIIPDYLKVVDFIEEIDGF